MVIIATAFLNHPHVKGVVEFFEKGSKVVIKGTLKSKKYKNSVHGLPEILYACNNIIIICKINE